MCMKKRCTESRQPAEGTKCYSHKPYVSNKYILYFTKITKPATKYEPDSHPAGQQTPYFFLKIEGSLPCSQKPDTGLHSGQN